jgi:hypothetical protein
MKEIPQHCIDLFKEKFNLYPSIVDIVPTMTKEDTDKFFSKHHLLWFEDIINDKHDVIPVNKLYEYDSSGILILRKSNTKIFILTKCDKKNAVDYLLQQLKKLTIKKD